MDILTIGGATRDITFYTDEGEIVKGKDLTEQKLVGFEYGAKMVIDKVFYTNGGGACNTAVSFSRLGMKVGSIMAVGNDENGEEIIKELKAEKVKTGFAQVLKNQKTAFSFVVGLEKAKEHILFAYRGASDNLEIAKNELGKIKADWIYITSLSGPNWQKVLNTVFTYAMDQGIVVAWNPGNKQLQAGAGKLARFLSMTEVLILNRDEAIELVASIIKNKNDKRLNNIKFLFNELRNAGCSFIVITDGAKGAYASNGKIYHALILAGLTRKDTTGVGDAFGSAFIAGYINNNNIVDGLRWGIVNSAYTTSQTGAHNGLLRKKELEKHVGKVKVKIV